MGLWCLTFQLYCGIQFYWWTKLDYPENTTNLQVTDKLYNTMLSCHEQDSNSQLQW